MVETTFALYTSTRFDLTTKQTGLVLSYAGLLTVIMTLFGIPSLTCRMSEHNVLIAGSAILAVSLLGIAAAPNMKLFLAAITLLAVGRALFRTSTDAVVTKCALPEDNGAVSGASDAAQSACRVLAPALAGGMMQYVGPSAPAAVGGGVAAVGTILLHYAMIWAVQEREREDAAAKKD